jgi:hypothetical protein
VPTGKFCYVIPAGYNWGTNPLASWFSKFSNNPLLYITLVFQKKEKKVKRTDQRTASPLVGYLVKTINSFRVFERAGTDHSLILNSLLGLVLSFCLVLSRKGTGGS